MYNCTISYPSSIGFVTGRRGLERKQQLFGFEIMRPVEMGLSELGADADLKEPREHVGRLAPDDKKARVELPEVSVQIL